VSEDGTTTRLEIDPDVGVNVSSCEYLMATL
jgi:hypothetical protein